ncbi:MAG: hypothetical protein RL215_2311, partial [Planctomycetota bacterium]
VEELCLLRGEWRSVVDMYSGGADEEGIFGEGDVGAGDADGVDGLIGSSCESEEAGSEAEDIVGG